MHPEVSASVIGIVVAASLLILSLCENTFSVPDLLPYVVLGSIITVGIVLTRNWAYKHATASFVSMVFSLTPVFVAVISFPLLGERLTTLELIGGAIIVGSTFFVEKFKI